MVAFVTAAAKSTFAGSAIKAARIPRPTCPATIVVMESTTGNEAPTFAPPPAKILAPRLKNSGFLQDGRFYKVTYTIPIAGRTTTNFQEPTYDSVTVSFANLYAEQVRIHQSGRSIIGVEKVSGIQFETSSP